MSKKNKKTIWVINQFAGTPTSGWGERHFYFAQYWIKQGYNVKIISGSYNHMFKNTVEVKGLYKKETYSVVDFIWIKTPKYNPASIKRFLSNFIFMFKLFLLPSSKIDKPDIIIVSSPPIFSILPGIILKKRHKAKLIFEIRDIWPLTLQLIGNKSKYHPAVIFIGWFEKIGYRKSDCVVSLLPNAKKHIENVANKNVLFKNIPNGIDSKLLSDELAPLDLIESLPSNKFIIGYAGTVGRANALEYLIDAAIKLRNDDRFLFVIVGDGYFKEKLIKQANSSKNILFYPKIRKNQVQNLLSYFDVCYVGRHDLTLYKHGVSANKYFDYMLAGKPVLDSNNFIKDPVELSGCGIIVKPESSTDIIDGLVYLYNLTPSEREEMGRKGYEYVIKEHNIENLSMEYIDIFESL